MTDTKQNKFIIHNPDNPVTKDNVLDVMIEIGNCFKELGEPESPFGHFPVPEWLSHELHRAR